MSVLSRCAMRAARSRLTITTPQPGPRRLVSVHVSASGLATGRAVVLPVPTNSSVDRSVPPVLLVRHRFALACSFSTRRSAPRRLGSPARDGRTPDQIFESCGSLDPNGLAAAFDELVRQAGVDQRDARLGELVQKLAATALKLQPKRILYALVACRRLRTKDAGLIKALCDAAKRSARSFEARDLTTTFNALANLTEVECVKDKDLLEELCRAAEISVGNFSHIGVALTFNALKKLDHEDAPLLSKLVRAAESKVTQFTAQGIALTFNSLAHFNIADTALLGKLVREAENKIEEFDPQNIANTMNALGAFKHQGRLATVCAA